MTLAQIDSGAVAVSRHTALAGLLAVNRANDLRNAIELFIQNPDAYELLVRKKMAAVRISHAASWAATFNNSQAAQIARDLMND